MSFTAQGGEFPQVSCAEDVVSFNLGQPSPALLPLASIHEVANKRLAAGQDALVLQYGAAEGYFSFRHDLAQFLSSAYRFSVDPDQLMVTGGNSLALSLVCQVFARPGGTVVCCDPTYFLARGIFEMHHLTVTGIEVDRYGLQVSDLEQGIARGEIKPDLVYVIPSFQNPTGVTLTPQRCETLVALAEAHDFIIVADEPYVLLHFDEAPPRCMMSYDQGRGRVLSLGTFSKILAPGLRLGWAHAAPGLLERLAGHGSLRSGGGLNPVMASIVHGTLENGFLRSHVALLRETYARRAATLTRALRTKLRHVTFHQPGGGFFLWLDFGQGVNARELLKIAIKKKTVFTPGDECAVAADLRRFGRLCFAFHTSEELEIGVDRLTDAMENLQLVARKD